MQGIQLLLLFVSNFCSYTANEQHGCPVGADCPAVETDEVSLLQLPRSSMTMGTSRETPRAHFWSRRGGDARTSSSTPHMAPTDLSSPSWIWKNELDEQVRHSPLIDSDQNIYVATATRIRKFSSSGSLLWTWDTGKYDGKITNSPALYEDAIFAVTSTPGKVSMYSIDLADGRVKWQKNDNPSLAMHNDCGSVTVVNNTMLVPMMENVKSQGNSIVYAMNASDGSHLWNFNVDDTVWNFAPATPGDGSMLFATTCGGVYRIDFSGNLLWRKGTAGQGRTCSTGGGTLGPNGVFYIEYNDGMDGGAHIMAYKADDGALLWSKRLEARYQGWQFPAVGKLGAEGPLALVVAVGGITSEPNMLKMKKEDLELPKDKHLHNAVMAMDASSGKLLWRFEEEPWNRTNAAGDVAKLYERLGESQHDFRRDTGCAPDVQGIPLIAGDGTVFMSSGHTGDLRAIKDVDRNGIIDKEEVSLFSTHQCFLNSPSLAPGMLVVAPCWGPMYVFKEGRQ